MTWFKVDDSLAFHAKTVAAGNPAMGLWVRAGSWCAQQLTDGHIPTHMIAALGTRGQAAALVKAGLWEATGDGWRFCGWDERNPTKAEVEADRDAAKERMRKAREARRAARETDRCSPDVRANTWRSSEGVRLTPTRPDPTRSIPLSAGAVPSPPEPTAQTLIAEHVDACNARPPGNVIGQLAKSVAGMLAEGIPADAVRAGLGRFREKPMHPSVLPSLVNECLNPPRRAGVRSTTDERVGQALALRDKFAAEEASR